MKIRSYSKWWAKLSGLIAVGLMVGLLPVEVGAATAVIRRIEVKKDPLSVNIVISREVPAKVIQVGRTELLIALKNISLDKGFTIDGQDRSLISRIAVERMQGDVMAVLLTGAGPLDHVRSGYNPAKSSFIVTLGKSGSQKTTPSTDKASLKKRTIQPGDGLEARTDQTLRRTTEPVPEKNARIPDAELQGTVKPFPASDSPKPVQASRPKVYVPPERQKGKYQGDISDLVIMIDESGCDDPIITDVLSLLARDRFQEAFDVLNTHTLQDAAPCPEPVVFLKAYAYLKSVTTGDFARLVAAERMYQDALVAYPGSGYVPHAYAAMGIIQKRMNNLAAAEGYFNIVRQNYAAYPGRPEIMYYLGTIHEEKGEVDTALTYFKEVFEAGILNRYIPAAGVAYGRGLYRKLQYLDALSVLNHVAAAYPDELYAGGDLLSIMGNAGFELGQSRYAREAFIRLLNLYPGIQDPDLVLSRIGDTYGMENNSEKAVKVYELVRERYPDTEGYIASSMGIARYLPTDQEKIDIYEMIKKRFPDNSHSRVAMMRLAEIYQAKGDYDKCIKEIEDLLIIYPRGMRYEAVKLMQKAYEGLFQKQLKSDEYTRVLNRYEKEHPRIDRMGSREIALTVGLSYLKAKLYEEAFNHLISAYKQYDRSSRPPELLFGLGVAMDESGRDEDALRILNAFSDQFPKDDRTTESLVRAATLYHEKKAFDQASGKFAQAYLSAPDPGEKGRILMSHALVHETRGNMKAAAELREKAVTEFALMGGNTYELLTRAHKELGRSYMDMKHYVKAADSYLKALNLSESDQEKANLGFLLGDAYQKGNVLPKAREIFKQVADSYDSVWARMAEQRLNTLDLAQALRNS